MDIDNQFATIILHHGMNDREVLRHPEFCNLLMMKFIKAIRLPQPESIIKAKYYVEVAQHLAFINDIMRPEIYYSHPTNIFIQKRRHIHEIDELFFDVFDPETNSYVLMSDDMKNSYDYSLKLFYNTFTGKPLPIHIKKFSDVCVESTCMSLTESRIEHEDLFSQYALRVRAIELAVRSYQDKLYDIFTSIMIVTDTDVTFNPEFSRTKLQPIFSRIREIMLELERELEVAFKEIEQYFEAIIEKQFLITTLFRIRHLEKSLFQLY